MQKSRRTAAQVAGSVDDSMDVGHHLELDDLEVDDIDALFKTIIIGDTGVGKSCLLARLISKEFSEDHNVTIGVEFGNFSMLFKEKLNVKLQIWDTAGQEAFRSITRTFYKGATAAIIVFDMTNADTFQNVRTWYKDLEENADEDIIVYVVANFADLEEHREVSTEEALELMRELGCHHYLETSALTGQNVVPMFETITKHLFLINEDKLDDFMQDDGDQDDVDSFA